MSPRSTALCLALPLLILGGCATASKPAAMTVTTPVVDNRHPASVAVNVTGGKETSATGTSLIANEDLRSAIVQSIRQSGLFAAIQNPADYQLDVYLARLSQPKPGFNMTVTLEMNWTLIRTDNSQVMWQKGIAATHTAKAGEALAGVKRLRLANEGAARENIKTSAGRSQRPRSALTPFWI